MAINYNIEIEDLIYGLPIRKQGKLVQELTMYQFFLILIAIINSHKNRLNKILQQPQQQIQMNRISLKVKEIYNKIILPIKTIELAGILIGTY